MNTADWFSIGALIIASISPMAVGWYTHHLRHVDIAHERERIRQEEDRRTEIAAEALRIAQDLVADSRKLNKETRERVSEITQMFPNGNLTAALQRELASVQAALSAMRDVAKIKEVNNIPVFPQTQRSIKALEDQLEVMTQQIKERTQSYCS